MEGLNLAKEPEVGCEKLFQLNKNNQGELGMCITATGELVMMEKGLTLTSAATLLAYLQSYVLGMIMGGQYSKPSSRVNPEGPEAST